MRKQGFIFPRTREYTHGSSGTGRGNGVFSFFFFGLALPGICVSTADELIPAGVDSVACSVDTGTIISVCSDKDGGEKFDVFHPQ